MNIEWQFRNTSTDATHDDGFQRCTNAPAIGLLCNAYANGEDGSLYMIRQGGPLLDSIFSNQAVGAAYTQLWLGPNGRIDTENDGILFAGGHYFKPL